MKSLVYTIYGIVIFISLVSCNNKCQESNNNDKINCDSVCLEGEKQNINNMLDSFNLAAANADFDLYFSYYAEDAVFIGTDANENWCKDSFMVWSKPFFDKGKAWDFTSLDRNVYFDETGKVAWFDELLDTQMKICRGSGVLVKQGENWKIKQYVLSMTVPNSETKNVVELKAEVEDSLITVLKH